MRRVFKTRHFSRWMRKTELTDSALCTAVSEMENGLIDAELFHQYDLLSQNVPMVGAQHPHELSRSP
ncbi:MAG: type II toxin-antitoxin system RelE/ParE family toxin [Gammaproteobacteria bacterium]